MPLRWIMKKLRGNEDIIDVPKVQDIVTAYTEIEMIDERSPKPVVTPKKNVMLVKKKVSEVKFPIPCQNCPSGRLYHEQNIFQCPECHLWFCGRHFSSHVAIVHAAPDYKVTATDGGSARYTRGGK